MPAPRLSAGADARAIGDVWRRTFDLNVRYYRAVGRLALDYWRGVAGIVAAAAAPRAAVPAADPPARPAPVMALEAAEGGSAVGVFMVENNLSRRVSGPIHAGPFLDATGREVETALRFEPEVATLEPGEQLLVQVSAEVSGDLDPGVDYRGEIHVPDLAGTRVPVVLRRVAPRRRR